MDFPRSVAVEYSGEIEPLNRQMKRPTNHDRSTLGS